MGAGVGAAWRPDPTVGRALRELVRGLVRAGGVTDLWAAGSLATGDHVAGVSDLDLVALTDGPLRGERLERIADLHHRLDLGTAAGLDLGCQYADATAWSEVDRVHPTWTHGHLVERTVSLVTRAELAQAGRALLGRPPQEVVAPVGPAEVRAAARAELDGYWRWAGKRPLLFLTTPEMVDLGLTAMARGRHALMTGELLTKTAAVEQIPAPPWLRDQVRARRAGDAHVASPRLRSAYLAWRDVRRTTHAVGALWSEPARPEV